MKKVVLISTSLSATSKSVLIQSAAEQLKKSEVIDLKKLSIPFCDGRKMRNIKEIQLVFKK